MLPDSHHPLSGEEKEQLRATILATGAVAVGFAEASDVSADFHGHFRRWLAKGMAGPLHYMNNHSEARTNPSYLLPGAATVISLAFPYFPARRRADDAPMVGMYAYGRDYHKTIRSLTKSLLAHLNARYGAENRLCVDSAPLPERYWALRAGIGRKGRNSTIIVEEAGSFVVLAEILTTLAVEPDAPSAQDCLGCGRCLRACPTGALTAEGLDASRCLSALTIEVKGEWDENQKRIMATEKGRATLFGCDRCQTCCPHNSGVIPTPIKDFLPRRAILDLRPEELIKMTEEEFAARFSGTPLMRGGLDSLRRNALNILGSAAHASEKP